MAVPARVDEAGGRVDEQAEPARASSSPRAAPRGRRGAGCARASSRARTRPGGGRTDARPSTSTSSVSSSCSTLTSMNGYRLLWKTRKNRSTRTSTLDGWSSDVVVRVDLDPALGEAAGDRRVGEDHGAILRPRLRIRRTLLRSAPLWLSRQHRAAAPAQRARGAAAAGPASPPDRSSRCSRSLGAAALFGLGRSSSPEPARGGGRARRPSSRPCPCSRSARSCRRRSAASTSPGR